ncbi:MAG: DUF2203 domain-containing protein [Ignavibacteria bacterium]|nr:DUF2203 domain-containing protein [Ignavibacteria bacterium]MBI3766201.1 DUF2203 domain-containing protein [Ignavibacteriales bacterium]
MAKYLHQKHFTLDQARRMVSGISHLVEEIVTLKKKLDERGFDVYRHQYFGGSGPNGERFFPPELERLVEIAKQLDRKGIVIKGLDEGLIDFPHVRSNGEEVYLCWKLGESEINFWHLIPDGFVGRKPVSDL